MVWVDPHQRESKRGTGHVVFVLYNPTCQWSGWISTKENQREAQDMSCLCFPTCGWSGVDLHQRESKIGTGHVVFVLPILWAGLGGSSPKRIVERHRTCCICASQTNGSLVWGDPHQRESKRSTGHFVFVLSNQTGRWSVWTPPKRIEERHRTNRVCASQPVAAWSGVDPHQRGSKKGTGNVMFVLPNLWLAWMDPHQRELKRGTGHVVFVLPNLWLVWVDPHQRESKRGTGHVVFVSPNLWLAWMDPHQRELKRGTGHVVFVLPNLWLVWVDPHQRESKRGTGQVVFVFPNLWPV